LIRYNAMVNRDRFLPVAVLICRVSPCEKSRRAGGMQGDGEGVRCRAELSLLEVDVAHLAVAHVGAGVEAADEGLAPRRVRQVGQVDVVRVLS